MFQSEQEKRYRTFDGRPVHNDFTYTLIKDPVIQGGLLVSVFTAAVIAPSSVSRAVTTFIFGLGGTLASGLASRAFLAYDMHKHFNSPSANHAIDTQPEYGTPAANETLTKISRDFKAAANLRMRACALVLGLYAAYPVTRVVETLSSFVTGMADKTQGNDMLIASCAVGFLISQWRQMGLHQDVEHNKARIVQMPAPERK